MSQIFYCDRCGVQNGWPEGFGESRFFAACELCGRMAIGNKRSSTPTEKAKEIK